MSEAARRTWTDEQTQAIARREGELLLDAAAGSGKTSVLVERFVRAVLDDEMDVPSILTITFTEKAATEMRERIRARLRELGALDEARATEGAFISTIHGFCARVLRAHALAAGIDPGFVVLSESDAARLSREAFDHALEELAASADGAKLISSYGIWDLAGAVRSAYAQLRSRGERHPRLPVLVPAPDIGPAGDRLIGTAAAVLRELGALADPSPRVLNAMERLERVAAAAAARIAWPGDLEALRLPGGNGAALRTAACLEYADALAAFRDACAHHLALAVRDRLDGLLSAYGREYERRKRAESGVDFEDLELLCLELLRANPELRDRYRERFERVMVDELQDTNAVQLELIEEVAHGNRFMVGDAQQSIYAFRHADVELFERRRAELAARGAHVTLTVNFRSRPEILEVINRAFGPELGEGFTPLVPGRAGEDEPGTLVELLLIDRGVEEPASEELPIAWRTAEARMLAERVSGLIEQGASPRDVVLLTRATTDMRTYETALEERGIPTYVIGGRGYWSHAQVLDVVAYLRVLANPRDEEALYTVLVSPLVGVSYDALVLIGAAARDASRDPWAILTEGGGRLDELSDEDRRPLTAFTGWLAAERGLVGRAGVQELIERMLERTAYDVAVLGMLGGRRRLANVRKLMRLGREHDGAHGPDLRAFLDLVAERSRGGWARGEDDSEAPVEGEALDAVRLMTIHRAKGLEFEIVCVADLGRWPRWGGDVVRIGRDGSFGLRLARPGTGRREAALAYDALGEADREAQAREERRLFYVAATRARERLIFSGAANVQAVWGGNPGSAPIGWLGPALVPDLPAGPGEGVVEGVRYQVAAPPLEAPGAGSPAGSAPGPGSPAGSAPGPPSAVAAAPVQDVEAPGADTPADRPTIPGSLSYTALAEYQRCGYRFYVERIAGLPARETAPGGSREGADAGLAGAERGTVVHTLLERLDFRRPLVPDADAVAAAAGRPVTSGEAADIAGLIERFAAGELCARLGGARSVRREQPFAFPAGPTLITGALDVLAEEQDGGALVLDYKTDRLDGRAPQSVVEGTYMGQRLIYALAVLRAGFPRVEVLHVFLERPAEPVAASFGPSDEKRLGLELDALLGDVRHEDFRVSDSPHRGLCLGCPAEGGLCSWPIEMTRRESPERLF